MGASALKAAATGRDNPDDGPKARLQAFRRQLDQMRPELATVLGKQIPVDRFISAAWAAVMNNDKLVEADRMSFFTSLRQAANCGLTPDGRECVLNIYRTNAARRGETARWVSKVQFLVMWGGLVKLLYDTGEITYIDAACVFEADHFAFRRGDAPAIEHEPYLGSEDPGPIVAAYAIVKLRNGETKREVMPLRDILKVKAASSAGDSENAPWQKWPDQMAIKSVGKRICKQLPRNRILDLALKIDDEQYTVEGAITEKGAAPAEPVVRGLQFQPGQTVADLYGEPRSESPEPLERTAASQQEHARQAPEPEPEPVQPKRAQAGRQQRRQAAAQAEDAREVTDNAGDGRPEVTYAGVREAIERAESIEALDEACSLIDALDDLTLQDELINEIAAPRREALEAQPS